MAKEIGTDVADVQERLVFQEGQTGRLHLEVEHVQRKVGLAAHDQHDAVLRQTGRNTQQPEDVQQYAPVHVHVDGVFLAGKVGPSLREGFQALLNLANRQLMDGVLHVVLL